MVANSHSVLLLLIGFVSYSLQKSSPTDSTYHAGVVEFAVQHDKSEKENLVDNTNRIMQIIESDDAKDLDILLFPEYVINNNKYKTHIPDPKDHIAPCDSAGYDNFLNEISCSIRSRGIYVVINVVEEIDCNAKVSDAQRGCPKNGINTYNTNVVFDRQGVVISRYRKTHLYRREWYYTDVLKETELATFTTDFGVTFGHFICFDMLFYKPAQYLIDVMNVTDIVYTTYWFSELPFLTAVQLQQGWAYANNVNLLAADSSVPAQMNTGSGIYAGKHGRLVGSIYEIPTTKLFKAIVPKRNSAYQIQSKEESKFVPDLETPRFTKLTLLRDYNIDVFKTSLLPEDFLIVNSTKLCHEHLCCSFDLKRVPVMPSSTRSAYRYRLAVYNGADDIGKTTFQRVEPSAIATCAVLACTTEDLISCGHIFPEGTTVGNKYYFDQIWISGDFYKAKRYLIMPSTVDGNMMPLSASEGFTMETTEGKNTTHVEMGLSAPKLDLLTFGIYVNYFSERQSKHNYYKIPSTYESQKSSAAMISTGIFIWFLIWIRMILA